MDMDNPGWFPETSLGNGNGIIEPLEISLHPERLVYPTKPDAETME